MLGGGGLIVRKETGIDWQIYGGTVQGRIGEGGRLTEDMA